MIKQSDLSRSGSAQRELARRTLARESLIDFCAYVDPDAAPADALDPFVQNPYRARHLTHISKIIERAMDGSLWHNVPGDGKKIVLITTPPGHWKSSLVSRKFPPFYIGKQFARRLPHQVILTSYNASLAEENNRAALELVRDNPLYANVFPEIQLNPGSQSSEKWGLAGESFPACIAAGVGGGLTGKHGIVVVDDPIRDRAQANSPTYISTLWEWWVDVVRTRPRRDEFILGIWTRWTEMDPAGKLMADKAKGENDERIVYIRLPALAETHAEREAAASMGLPVDNADPLGRQPGESLWPDEASAAEHEATKRSFPLTFESLYQGRPRPTGGHVVGRNNFKMLPVAPKLDIRWVMPVDWAYTEKETAPRKTNDPDYVAVGVLGLWTPGGNRQDARLVLAYAARKQAGQHEAKQFVKQNMLALGSSIPVRSAQDGIDRLFLDAMRQDADLIRFSIKNLSQMKGDKVTKATPWMEIAQAGNFYVVAAPWNDDFFSSVERFPHGAHDDYEDMISVGTHYFGLGHKIRKASSQQVQGFGR